MSDVATTHLRDGCYVCGPQWNIGGKRPPLVVSADGRWIVCARCQGSYGEATPGAVAALNGTPAPTSPPEPAAGLLRLPGWTPAVPGARLPPVASSTRVQCILANGFAAEGVACAFTWRPGSSRSVAFWRRVPQEV